MYSGHKREVDGLVVSKTWCDSAQSCSTICAFNQLCMVSLHTSTAASAHSSTPWIHTSLQHRLLRHSSSLFISETCGWERLLVAHCITTSKCDLFLYVSDAKTISSEFLWWVFIDINGYTQEQHVYCFNCSSTKYTIFSTALLNSVIMCKYRM